MSVSFEEIGQVLVTCKVKNFVSEGAVVKIAENGTVALCAAGEDFCGVVVSMTEDNYAAVQLKGFVRVACSDSTVGVGWVKVIANGFGGVKAAGSSTQGRELLVMSRDDENLVVCL